MKRWLTLATPRARAWALFAAGAALAGATYRLEVDMPLLALSGALTFCVLFWRARPSGF